MVISNLEEKARAEQGKRQELEQNKKKLEGTLSEKEKSLSASKAEAAAAQERALQSQKEAEVKQAALIAEQARAKELMLQVEKESKQKFFTELRTYRDMAQKGREQLDNAAMEINAKRDVTALIYVSQGKILFEEAKPKTVELRIHEPQPPIRGRWMICFAHLNNSRKRRNSSATRSRTWMTKAVPNLRTV